MYLKLNHGMVCKVYRYVWVCMVYGMGVMGALLNFILKVDDISLWLAFNVCKIDSK